VNLSQFLSPFLQFCEMFEKLKNKWGVGSFQLLFILVTFALGGSACGMVGKKILSFLHLSNRLLNISLYILLITFLWPLCVLLISIPFGQFQFFRNYISRVIKKLSGKKKDTDLQ
jgi:hypothetical protein